MVWEFPAVSQSRKEFWGEPQYTRFGMWLFTLFFGFWGVHHLMLRSPQTALMCCLVNIFTFGYWYFYDLIQLSSKEYGGLGDDGLNAYGLGSPWGPLGIAQGMWIQPPSLAPQPQQPQQPQQPPQQGGSKEPAKPRGQWQKHLEILPYTFLASYLIGYHPRVLLYQSYWILIQKTLGYSSYMVLQSGQVSSLPYLLEIL